MPFQVKKSEIYKSMEVTLRKSEHLSLSEEAYSLSHEAYLNGDRAAHKKACEAHKKASEKHPDKFYSDLHKKHVKSHEEEFSLTKYDPMWQYLEMLSKNDLNKGIKHVLASAALAMTPTTATVSSKPIPTMNNIMNNREQAAHDVKKTTKAQTPSWDKQKTLKAIAQQESNSGKNTNHALIEQGTEKGTYAHGRYGLTDNLIRETVKSSPRLSEKHSGIVNMDNQHINEYLESNPDLEHEVASRYHDRISKELGTTHPSAVYIGWLHGIEGAKKYLKNHKIEEHQIATQVLGNYHKVK